MYEYIDSHGHLVRGITEGCAMHRNDRRPLGRAARHKTVNCPEARQQRIVPT
jgi:hypothetical protein